MKREFGWTGILRDLKMVTRGLIHNPSYPFFACLCLGLGMGAAAIVFTIGDALLIRPLPFPASERLLNIWMTVAGDDETQYFVSSANFNELQRQAENFQVAGVQAAHFNLGSGEGEPEMVPGAYATANLAEVLAIEPLAGRFFSLQEETAETPVCVIAEDLWRGRLGGSRDLVGSTIRLNGQPWTVVGVMPRLRGFPDTARVWIPITQRVRSGRNGILTLARMAEGRSLEAVSPEVARIAQDLKELDPVANRNRGLAFASLGESLMASLAGPLRSLAFAVGFVLLIALVNVVSLSLVRFRRRAGDLAVLAALGASRRRLAGQFFLESLLLCCIGALLAGLLAHLSVPLLTTLSPIALPEFVEVSIDGRILGFIAAVAVLGAAVIGLVPAWLASRQSPGVTVRSGSRGNTLPIQRFQTLLLVADVALALLLIAGAGLMIRSFYSLTSTSPGFQAQDLYRLRLQASANGSESHESRIDFIARIEETLSATPGIEATGSTHSLPIAGLQYFMSFQLQDRPRSEGQAEMAVFQMVTPNFFKSMVMPILRGRSVLPSDRADSPTAIVVSEALARKYWPDGEPLGKRLKPDRAPEESPWWEIVGVVPDVRDRGLATAVVPSMYVPITQLVRDYAARFDVMLRTSMEAGALASTVRARVREIDPNAIILEFTPVSELLSNSLRRERFMALLTGIFAALAWTLAGAGVYGVLAYGVHQRQEELGVRLALGASPEDLKRLLVWSSLRSVLVGSVIGGACALLIGRGLADQLHGVEPSDPINLLGSTALLLLAGALASYLPARRAARVDPALTLRKAG